MGDMKDVLKARGNKHGDFIEMSNQIKRFDGATRGMNYEKLPAYQQHAIDLIIVKMGRILVGDNNYDDHWRDIAGYALKVLDCLPKDPPAD